MNTKLIVATVLFLLLSIPLVSGTMEISPADNPKDNIFIIGGCNSISARDGDGDIINIDYGISKHDDIYADVIHFTTGRMLIRNRDTESIIHLDILNDEDIGIITIGSFDGYICWLKNPFSDSNYILIMIGKHYNMKIDIWNE